MKICIIHSLLAMLFAVGCTSVPRDVVKVGTYNIRLSGVNGSADRGTPNAWKERKEDLLALVRSLDLDVFGLQEVCPDQAEFLRKNLIGYEFVGEHRNADRVSGEASPVCYRKSRFDALAKGTFSGWKWQERELSIPEALEAPIAERNASSPDSVKDATGVHPYEKYGARIEYIYVSPGVKVLEFETVNAPRPGKKLYPSDHFPVAAVIEL